MSLTPLCPPRDLFCWLNFTFSPLSLALFFFVSHYGASMVLSSLTKLIIPSPHLSLSFCLYFFSTSGLYNFIKHSTYLPREEFQLLRVVFTPCSFTNKPSCFSESPVPSVLLSEDPKQSLWKPPILHTMFLFQKTVRVITTQQPDEFRSVCAQKHANTCTHKHKHKHMLFSRCACIQLFEAL